ncbi:MAG: PTS system mannose/fructose/sorbose family transporter subunit IID [Desulfuromonadaceae bacterium]|jgi:PTS system mannose-specific IID component|nr:PTS system mannose/fructose/sorbose family transporter subunit IID [Desulfuromonas sp.]MDY0184690.1 PTS system mannose/fructose/sorbose family transporter subunit IID [Desulfuromonadaceae bacterium]
MHKTLKNLLKPLLKLNVRCMLLQSCWNFRVFQGLGSLWILQPFRRDMHRSDTTSTSYESQTSTQQLKYFNTNTFCAPCVFAAQLALQEKQANGEHVVIKAEDFPAAVMAPVAAVGDALFWGGLRPLAALSAIILVLLGYMWAPVVVVPIFTLPTTIVRIGGSVMGFIRGAQVVALIQQLHLADLAIKIKQINIALLGVVTALAWRGVETELDPDSSYIVIFAAAFILMFGINVFLLRRRIPVVVLLGLTLIVFSAVGSAA